MVFIRHAFKNTVLFLFVLFISCGSNTKKLAIASTDLLTASVSAIDSADKASLETAVTPPKTIVVGANQTATYVPLLENKKVAIVGNQTSVIFRTASKNTATPYVHLVDSLLARGVAIQKVFAPEHGFRGKADAAELVADGRDTKTGLPIISLYGKNKKPSAQSLAGIDLVIFDIQDVGVRFYTYISTLHYVMQICAQLDIPMLILDRPNPNGHYVDGPTLDLQYTSFVGVHPIPLVHGMTIGEYAQMVNGQGWLGNGLKCKITVIPVQNYTHTTAYSLPIRPSPNLPNDKAINLYPSLGFLEGTTLNAGRGTELQFQIFGSPTLPKEQYDFSYTPQANFGAKHPKHKGILCHGVDLRNTPLQNGINLQWLIDAYHNSNDKAHFFKTKSFTIHAGSPKLQQQIIQKYTFREIRKTWLADLEKFKKIRAQYLLYD